VQVSRAPWWFYVLAASFLGCFALQCFTGTLGQAFGYEQEGTTALVTDVISDSIWARAGVRPGDRITALDRVPFSDWDVAVANIEAGRPFILQIERDHKNIELAVVADRRSLSNLNWLSREMLVAQGITLILALLVAFRRPFDPLARIGAWCLASLAVLISITPSLGWAADWRRLPLPLGLLLWPAWISGCLGPGSFLTFVAVFPRRLFRSRWLWAFTWAPIVVITIFQAAVYSQLVYRPPRPITSLGVYRDSVSLDLMIIGYLIADVVALLMSYHRLQDVNERRRLRILVFGAIVALFGLGSVEILFNLIPAQVAGYLYFTPVPPLLFALYFAFPFSFAYVILRHRVFDLGIILRQSLQYALARRLLLSAVPALAAIFLADLLLHGNQPILTVFRARGWMYGALAALAVLAYARRDRWLETLDRRFFREHYDARRLLREVAEEVHAAHSFEQEAPRVVARIEAALHPEFAALMVREPQDNLYRTLVAAPAGQGPLSLPKDSKLLALVRLLGKPLEVPQSESGWLRQLPHEDTEFLRRARIDFLVPVAVNPQHTEALIALGRKRSEEPYSGEDQDLLVAIAESLSILIERPAAPAAPRHDSFEECPQCGGCYESGSSQCAKEGARLVPVLLPRLLGQRYRLDQRLGRGGMGTVYKVRDTALDREVALKLIREDLLANDDAAQRFHREAKIAASFAHPGVVTVFDFGLHEDRRAFLVMELLLGRTLRAELLQNKRMSPARSLLLLKQVCAALEAAHKRQIVHRDLKPENLFLAGNSDDEVIKILDFGLGKFLDAGEVRSTVSFDTGAGHLLGTIYYMCPEQLKFAEVSPGWDLWALSVVAYEMLTGVHPFGGASIVECHRAIVGGNFTSIEKVLADAPPRSDEFFATSFSPDPTQRPQTATQWLALFEQKIATASRLVRNVS
jgi:tRNA A-37 threonylcarbamoyl transferase component Bud32